MASLSCLHGFTLRAKFCLLNVELMAEITFKTLKRRLKKDLINVAFLTLKQRWNYFINVINRLLIANQS